MSTNTVNISFDENLLKEIDEVAKSEFRSRSELLREAARLYIERKEKWKNIFSSFDKITENSKLTEKDVLNEIKEYRKSKSRKN
ncbi:MAG: ribbon-helix-helix domain-containing protein [Leptospirales bacterium]